MRSLWAPWRYEYLAASETAPEGCIFCHASAAKEDAGSLVAHRSEHCFCLLNLYPYTNGHVMVVPYAHAGRLSALDPEVRMDLINLVTLVEQAFEAEYHPDGMNVGMNLGRGAGAGIPDHCHIHVLPRWTGDTNFMTTTSETRVLSEELEKTRQRLSARLSQLAEESTS